MYTLIIKDCEGNVVSTVKGDKRSIENLASLYTSTGEDLGSIYDGFIEINENTVIVTEEWIDNLDTRELNRRIKF
ncbi:hypothetical protein NXG04_07880 [Klebsiella pneumoniae]|nr:hypothetical protein [Klebsiella pneumoniae]MDS7714474.1 hypothetical protein [Klebsiella pneumoniae]